VEVVACTFVGGWGGLPSWLALVTWFCLSLPFQLHRGLPSWFALVVLRGSLLDAGCRPQRHMLGSAPVSMRPQIWAIVGSVSLNCGSACKLMSKIECCGFLMNNYCWQAWTTSGIKHLSVRFNKMYISHKINSEMASANALAPHIVHFVSTRGSLSKSTCQ